MTKGVSWSTVIVAVLIVLILSRVVPSAFHGSPSKAHQPMMGGNG